MTPGRLPGISEGFGGHAMAAGLTIRRESLEGFRRALNAYYAAHPPRSAPCLEAELRIEDPRYLEMGSVASLDLLEPCGNGNPQPQLCMTDVRLESIMPMGMGKHLRLRLSKFRQNYEAVFFSQSLPELGLAEGQRADVMFFPRSMNSAPGAASSSLSPICAPPNKIIERSPRLSLPEKAPSFPAA